MTTRIINLLLTCFFGLIVTLSLGSSSKAETCTPAPNEKEIWDGIKNSDNPRLFLAYLNEYPKGCFRTAANFRIKALVSERLPLRVEAMFTGSEWRSAAEGEWVDYDGGRIVELFKMKAAPNPGVFALEYLCDSAGKGQSDWVLGDATCHPAGAAPVQGFGVRMRGDLKDFYNLEVGCSTIRRPGDGSREDFAAGDGGWCGRHGGDGSVFVYRLRVLVVRKPFDK